MQNNNSIDQIVSQALQNGEERLNLGAWANMERMLEGQNPYSKPDEEKKKRGFWLFGLMLLGLLTAGTSAYFVFNKAVNSNLLAQNKNADKVKKSINNTQPTGNTTTSNELNSKENNTNSPILSKDNIVPKFDNSTVVETNNNSNNFKASHNQNNEINKANNNTNFSSKNTDKNNKAHNNKYSKKEIDNNLDKNNNIQANPLPENQSDFTKIANNANIKSQVEAANSNINSKENDSVQMTLVTVIKSKNIDGEIEFKKKPISSGLVALLKANLPQDVTAQEKIQGLDLGKNTTQDLAKNEESIIKNEVENPKTTKSKKAKKPDSKLTNNSNSSEQSSIAKAKKSNEKKTEEEIKLNKTDNSIQKVEDATVKTQDKAKINANNSTFSNPTTEWINNAIDKTVDQAKKLGYISIFNKKYYVNPGIFAGINGSFFNTTHDFGGFQAGGNVLVELSKHISLIPNVGFYYRNNGGYSIKDKTQTITSPVSTFIDGSRTFYSFNVDSTSYNYNFKHVYSFEAPILLQYNRRDLGFYGGVNIAYGLKMNTKNTQKTTALKKSDTTATGANYLLPTNTETYYKSADFQARLGIGYVIGASYDFSPNLFVDFRLTQNVWDNSSTASAKEMSNKIFKVPSLQLGIGYRFKEKERSR